MSYATIRKLLEVQLNALSAGFATAWENVPYSPSTGTPWQRVTLLPGKTENPTMGDGFRREVGVLEVLLHYPPNKGSQEATARAEAIRAGFPRGQTFTEGSVRVLIDQHPSIGHGMNDGSWFVLPVSITYTGDIQG